MTPGDEEAAIRRSWDANAAGWTDAIRDGRIESRSRVTNAAVLAAISSAGARRVLDVGCGEGWLCRALSDLAMEPTGIDGSSALSKLHERPAAASSCFSRTTTSPRTLRGLAARSTLRCSTSHCWARKSCLSCGRRPTFSCPVARWSCRPCIRTRPPAATTAMSMAGGPRTSAPWAMAFTKRCRGISRTTGSWISAVRDAGFELLECREPTNPESGRPLSLLLCARLRPQLT